MPGIENTPSVNVCLVLPLTLDRFGSVKLPEDEEAHVIGSLEEAFERLRPAADFEIHLAPGQTFRVQHRFRTLRDFLPERVEQHESFDEPLSETECPRNDIAYAREHLESYRRVERLWNTESVRQKWKDPNVRSEILAQMRTPPKVRGWCPRAFRDAGMLCSHFPTPFWTAHSPWEVLAEVLAEFPIQGSWEDVAERIRERVTQGERLKAELLRAFFERIKGLEQNWRCLHLLFESMHADTAQRGAKVILHIVNADGPNLKGDNLTAVTDLVRRPNE